MSLKMRQKPRRRVGPKTRRRPARRPRSKSSALVCRAAHGVGRPDNRVAKAKEELQVPCGGYLTGKAGKQLYGDQRPDDGVVVDGSIRAWLGRWFSAREGEPQDGSLDRAELAPESASVV